MNEPFVLPITYKGEDLLFTAHLQQAKYNHSIAVDMYGTEVQFEPDEERNCRAFLEHGQLSKPSNMELLLTIAEASESIVKTNKN